MILITKLIKKVKYLCELQSKMFFGELSNGQD